MKILHCIYDHIRNPWVSGGGAVRVYEVYRRFPEEHDVTVVCGAYPGAADYREKNLCFTFLGSRRDSYVISTLSYTFYAARHLRTHAGEYDVVIEDFAPYNPVFTFFWHRQAVIQLHQHEGFRLVRKYALPGILFFLIERYYPLLFRNSVFESALGSEKFGLKGRVSIIPNGFDPRLLDLDSVEEDYLLFLGRLHIGQKGLDTLSEALRLVRRKLIIAGGGRDEGRARELFGDHVESGLVEFKGYVRGKLKEELLRRCLLVVMPSRYEGQPVTVMEAAACGKAVIVSDIPELAYAVDAGFALSFRTGSASDLAEKMTYVLNNSSLRRAMGKKAREYAAFFTWDRIAEEYETFLRQPLGETLSERK